MVVEIPFGVLAVTILKFATVAVREIGDAVGVAKELNEMRPQLDLINGVLVDAEEKQVKSAAVGAWLDMVKDVAYNVDDLLDGFAIHQLQQQGGMIRKVSNFFSSSNQFVFRSKASRKVKKIKKEVDQIRQETPSMLDRIPVPGKTELESSWRETHSFVFAPEILGREEDKRVMIEWLVLFDNYNDQQQILPIAAIVGMGGLGKTTLAQLVYNDPIVTEYFEHKIWVCVSNDFDIKLIVKSMLQSISKEDVESLRLEGLKNRLHETISQKRCLLVLDDVVLDDIRKKEENWGQLTSLLRTNVGSGSKIVVTTRNEGVVSQMKIPYSHKLKGLLDTPSWDLFAKIAFPEGQREVLPRFLEIGNEIANKCKGVPLLIKTLATIVCSKTKESEWLPIKDSENLLSLRGGQNDNALSILKLSYYNMPPYLKQCFAYCALLPKNHKIEKKSLVRMWIAQGYIQDDGIEDEYVGDGYFDELLLRSLMEVCETDAYDNILSYEMHDLIHDLACTVMGSEFLVLEDSVKEISTKVRHVSLFSLFKSMNLRWKALKVKQVRTFVSFATNYSYEDDSKRVHVLSLDDIIPRIDSLNFKRLRVLTLNGGRRERLRISLDKLRHLRYLDLSYNDFEKLPKSILRLKCLQTLRVVGCRKLKKLRRDTRELISLRYLENDGCPSLTQMPRGIGELTSIQSLSVFVVGNIGNGSKVGRLSELKGLNQLRGELSIVNLENLNVRGGGGGAEAREANLCQKQYIQFLRLEWGKRGGGEEADEDGDIKSESVLEGLHPHPSLKGLSIKGYGGWRFPNWMMVNDDDELMRSSTIRKLSAVNLEGCSRCQTLPCFVRLPHLRYLELRDLEKVEYIVDDHLSSNAPFFPSLQNLSLVRMQKLQGLWRMSLPTNPPPFNFLSSLKLTNCPLLALLPLPPTPLLSDFEIGYCDRLASLTLHSCPRLSKLQIYECHTLTSLLMPPSPLLLHSEIRVCNNLESLELSSSPLLSDLHISVCLKLKSLQLPPTPHLSSLKILGCPQLTSLQLSSLHRLKTLDLRGLREDVRQQFNLFAN